MSTTQSSPFRHRFVDGVTLGRLLVPILLLVLWQLLSTVLPARILPSPRLTVLRLIGAIEAGWFIPNLVNSMQALIMGFGLAAVAGFLLGVVLGTGDLRYRIAEPFILNIYAVPKIVLYPIFLFVFQLGMDLKVAFAGFHGFFPMLILTMSAVREVPDIYLNVGRSLRLSRVQMARHVIAPYVLVQLMVGIRLAFSLTFIGLLLAELVAAKSGIGLELRNAMVQLQTEKMMAIAVVLIMIAGGAILALYSLQRRLEERLNVSARGEL